MSAVGQHDSTTAIAPIAAASLERLERYCAQRDWAGNDPYDALNSALVRRLTFGKKWGRIAWIQLFRRSPVDLRRVVGVRPGHNPKALGLFLEGYVRMLALDGDRHLGKIDRMVELLREQRTDLAGGHGWGYNFDWQSKAFFVPRFTPTIVNSGFIGHALLDLHERSSRQDALDLAVPIADFMLGSLHRTWKGDAFAFSYTPLDRTVVHNANMLGASLLIRLYGLTGREELRTAALASLQYSMEARNEDGSWFYGEAPYQRWIDSFHTGFNLEALRHFLRRGEGEEWRAAYRQGTDFYADRFFLPDGSPKYYHDRLYPIDIHCPAQAITFFSGEGAARAELRDRVLRWTIEHMQGGDGSFYFRKWRILTNRVRYMRWTQAWAFRALTAYCFATRTEVSEA